MCGIVGYIGEEAAVPILLDGLKRLEYRGYDSSGLCVLKDRKLVIRKKEGKLNRLINSIDNAQFQDAHLGIAHTRWATHGAPSENNAHPHLDKACRIAVVHNGIIENYQEIKNQLMKEGYKFKSETDTEVVPHLISKYYKGDLVESVLKVIKEVRGSFAFGIICLDEPDKLVCVRRDSPLIVALGNKGNFVASDVPAILKHTRRVMYPENDQIVCLTRDRKVRVIDIKKRPVSLRAQTITWDISSAEKGGYDHFMLKEIFEQPEVWRRIISHRLTKAGQIHFEHLHLTRKELSAIKNIVIVACGTAYHAGLVGKYIIEKICRIPVWVDLSSEFRYRQPIVDKNTLLISISQSGETADTLAAVRLAKSKGARTLAICNVVGSSLVRESEAVIYTLAGPEIGVASTKAYTAQLMTLYLLAFHFSALKNTLPPAGRGKLIQMFKTMPHFCADILRHRDSIAVIAQRHTHFGCFLFLGRNINFPTALEGALKLKEISYIPAEGYAAGEMKHGPIALIDEYRVVFCIAPDSATYEKMVSNIQEMRSRKGKILIIATAGNAEIRNYADEVIYIPRVDELFSPLLTIIPLQLIAYYIATYSNRDVDQPRNLAKSVTVE